MMVDGAILEKTYKESLEESIITYIAKNMSISLEDAMGLYFNSKLSEKIQSGEFGVQYLDYKILGDYIIKNDNLL